MLIAWQYSAGRSVSRVSTLGLGGLFIATSDPPPVGALLKVVFDVPGGEVRARVIVKNIKPGHGMAVAFVQMEQEDRARLDQLLKNWRDKFASLDSHPAGNQDHFFSLGHTCAREIFVAGNSK